MVDERGLPPGLHLVRRAKVTDPVILAASARALRLARKAAAALRREAGHRSLGVTTGKPFDADDFVVIDRLDDFTKDSHAR